MTKNCLILSFFCLSILSNLIQAQEIKIFKRSDFDLKGKVKSCLVHANYGKEEYEFNDSGLLTMSVTRYSDTDYDISYYKYKNNFLMEKRVENYRDNVVDKETSIAHLFEIDSSGNRQIIEKIISYNKEYIDRYEYQYDDKNRLIKILRSNNDGNDETDLTYSNEDGVSITTYTTNGTITKELLVSMEKLNDSVTEKIVTSKSYLSGLLNQSIKKRFNPLGQMVSSEKHDYDSESKKLIFSETMVYSFDEEGNLSHSEAKRVGLDEIKEYIYQFDTQGNWVKEIIQPDNTYTTRKIQYYPASNPIREE